MKNQNPQSSQKTSILSNILSLGFLQGINYVLPLLTLPYLARVLGPQNFGHLALATAIVGYFVLLTDYGFNLSATREVSLVRHDNKSLVKVFSSVMMTKVFLALISLIALVFMIFIFDEMNKFWYIYILSFGVVVGQALFPVWFFRGMEKMLFITIVSSFARFFFTLTVFVFVRSSEDFWIVPLLTSLGLIFSGAVSIYLVRKYFSVRFKIQPYFSVFSQLRSSWYFFLSKISVSAYTISSTVILGIFVSISEVGEFAVVEKIIQALKGLYQPISEAIYPFVGSRLKKDKKSGLHFIFRTAFLLSFFMFIFSVLTYIYSDEIITFLFGEKYQHAGLVLRVMAFVPLCVVISNMVGVQTILNLGFKRVFALVLLIGAIIGILLNFILVSRYGLIGSAFTVLIVEIFVTLGMLTSFFIYINGKIK
jgi:PST family polysaccharide transporter